MLYETQISHKVAVPKSNIVHRTSNLWSVGFIARLDVAVSTKERRSIIRWPIAEKVVMNPSDFASAG
jgi:hypothetical protein